jgi:hypothetical protein
LGAHVRGFSAWLFALELEKTLPARLDSLSGSAPPELLAQARAAFADLREAGGQWQVWRASLDRSSEVVVSEAVSPSREELTTEQVAQMLEVTSDRVTQLLRAGLLDGRRAGRVWLVDVGSVELRRELRRGGAA